MTYSLTYVRVVLGVIVFAHGLAHSFGLFGQPGIEQMTADIAAQVSVAPSALAYVVAYAELLLGLALILGLFAKVAALIILALVVVYVLLSGRWHAFFLNNSGVEYLLAVSALCVAVATHGPGPLALKLPKRKDH